MPAVYPLSMQKDFADVEKINVDGLCRAAVFRQSLGCLTRDFLGRNSQQSEQRIFECKEEKNAPPTANGRLSAGTKFARDNVKERGAVSLKPLSVRTFKVPFYLVAYPSPLSSLPLLVASTA